MVRTVEYMITVLKKEGMLFELHLAALQLQQLSTKMVFMIKGINDAPAEPLRVPRKEKDSAEAV